MQKYWSLQLWGLDFRNLISTLCPHIVFIISLIMNVNIKKGIRAHRCLCFVSMEAQMDSPIVRKPRKTVWFSTFKSRCPTIWSRVLRVPMWTNLIAWNSTYMYVRPYDSAMQNRTVSVGFRRYPWIAVARSGVDLGNFG